MSINLCGINTLFCHSLFLFAQFFVNVEGVFMRVAFYDMQLNIAFVVSYFALKKKVDALVTELCFISFLHITTLQQTFLSEGR